MKAMLVDKEFMIAFVLIAAGISVSQKESDR